MRESWTFGSKGRGRAWRCMRGAGLRMGWGWCLSTGSSPTSPSLLPPTCSSLPRDTSRASSSSRSVSPITERESTFCSTSNLQSLVYKYPREPTIHYDKYAPETNSDTHQN
ncbi:hypothetical protein M427DRAFT_354425 [Gonapodya prolifera JEL478]|uniref:Uncharacterized protein n=1 Tax=Gonapodya prolifera (strain JEL478) TaxID=1344416 RepID=A0A139ABV2_GONPJ|nr:hypothetical protein M427DRAFT_354425 [Gonapodya prolifera JEL478]|eukprot:KXS14084.1 hypothetical protein M427DRAFT_354425 [Gonapodya prolifera JEL478]